MKKLIVAALAVATLAGCGANASLPGTTIARTAQSAQAQAAKAQEEGLHHLYVAVGVRAEVTKKGRSKDGWPLLTLKATQDSRYSGTFTAIFTAGSSDELTFESIKVGQRIEADAHGAIVSKTKGIIEAGNLTRVKLLSPAK